MVGSTECKKKNYGWREKTSRMFWCLGEMQWQESKHPFISCIVFCIVRELSEHPRGSTMSSSEGFCVAPWSSLTLHPLGGSSTGFPKTWMKVSLTVCVVNPTIRPPSYLLNTLQCLAASIARHILVNRQSRNWGIPGYDSRRQLILQVCLFTYREENVLLYLQTAHVLLAVYAGGALSFRVKLLCSKGDN